MKRLLIAAVLLCIFATSAMAAQFVYLKDGGVVLAQRVWRSKGKVQVLVNRDTLVEFNVSEVNMKKTFIKRHKTVSKKKKASNVDTVSVKTLPPAVQQQEKKKSGLALPTMPTLPEKKPADLDGKEEGTIRKHKREMAERAAE